MIKKEQSRRVLLYLCSVLLLIFTVTVEKANAVCRIDANGTYIEAEHFTGSSNVTANPTAINEFTVVSDTAANGGQALQAGNTGSGTTIPQNEVKEYTVDFQTTGSYFIWMRGEAYSGTADSIFFTVDNSTWKAWHFGGTYNSYIWTSGMQVGSGNTINIQTAGSHVIKIAMREPNTRVDGIYITQGTETPTDATVPANVTSIDPRTGCTGPYWQANPISLGPTCFVGLNAASISFDITNIGADETTAATISSNQTWAVIGNGTTLPLLLLNASHTVDVSFNTSTLATGTHQAELTVTGSAGNSPFTIPITLLVKDFPVSAACGEIPLYAENLVNPAIMVQLDTSGSMGTSMTIAQSGDQSTPDLAAIVQEIVDRTGWASSNAMAFVVSGSGLRRAWSFDGDSDETPTLTITYVDPVTNSPVTVVRDIVATDDDVQVQNGSLDGTANALAFGRANEPVGLRFRSVVVPQGATISSATLRFTAYQADTTGTSLTITGVAEDNVADLSALATASPTTASTAWNPGSWATSMSRIDIAEDVLKEVFMDRSIAWGFATWAGGSCRSTDPSQSPTYYTNYRIGVHEHDQTHQNDLQDKADDGSPSGCTPLAPTMRAGLEYFQGNRLDVNYAENYSLLSCQPRIVVVVTDGVGNTATDNTRIDAVVDDLIAEGVSVVAVGFGLSSASQLDRIVQKMQTAGEASDTDYLYHLHNENSAGVAIPFMAQNRNEFIQAMADIVNSVKAQSFHGSSPAPTTSAGNDDLLLIASFDASNWTGKLTATKFDPYTGALQATFFWDTEVMMPATINGFIFDSSATGLVSPYTDSSIASDNFLCKPMGDIINSTPVIVGNPPYFYKFDSYFSFKYDATVLDRDALVYVGANDGALHAFNLSDGIEKWRFYPESVQSKMSFTQAADDMCSSAYCHKFLLDGSPEPADIYVGGTTGWKTIITTGLGEGGSAFFALDVTYGEDFDAPGKVVNNTTVDVASKYLWEFTESDDSELGLATSWPTITRVENLANTGNNGWATYFGSGAAVNASNQPNKEAYLFAVNSWDKSNVWVDSSNSNAALYHVKLSSTVLLNDIAAPPLVLDHEGDGYTADRIYMGNMYGDMFRVRHIGFGETPVSAMLYDSTDFTKTPTKDHNTPVTAKASYGYAEGGDIWIYFGTGRYSEQIDKFSTEQQYIYGLFDQDAAKPSPYKYTDLNEMETHIVEAYAVDDTGQMVDLDGSGTAGDAGDLRKYRTLTCSSTVADIDGKCNPLKDSWRDALVTTGPGGSERVLTQPLTVGGITFFLTFIPDGDVCEGNGDTWLLAVDWETGEFLDEPVFDINENGDFDAGDTKILNSDGIQNVMGVYVGKGKPAGEMTLHGNKLALGTTAEAPKLMDVNLPLINARLRSWRQVYH